jgi:hypothetical protein
MYTNVGGIDKVVRIIAGCGLISLFFLLRGDARWLGLLGIVPLATGLARYCPLYSLFGWTTRPRKAKHA